MLTILWNRNNLCEDAVRQSLMECVPEGVGISADIPPDICLSVAKQLPIYIYDTGLYLDRAEDGEIAAAVEFADKLLTQKVLLSVGYSCDRGKDESFFAERLLEIKKRFLQRGISVLLSNRRPYIPGESVSVDKLLRLCKGAGIKIAHDIGASHVEEHALENYFDLRSETAALLLNDNFGEDYFDSTGQNDKSSGDIMLQPGYGNAPFVKIFEDVQKNLPYLPLIINGKRHQNASLKTVFEDTQILLEGRVYYIPLGACLSKNENGRIMRR